MVYYFSVITVARVIMGARTGGMRLDQLCVSGVFLLSAGGVTHGCPHLLCPLNLTISALCAQGPSQLY